MRTNSRLACLLVVLTFLASFTTTMFASPARQAGAPSTSAPDRVTQAVDDSKLVMLPGNTRPEANAANDLGPVPDAQDFDHIWLVLQRSAEQEKELDALIDSLNDRGSANFHQWLTPEQYGRFGVSDDDVNAIANWLGSHGFRVNQIYPNHMLIDFGGTAGSIREAFHTSIHQLNVGGQQHLANMTDPSIPSALAPVVKGITSLHDFRPHPMYRKKGDYTFTSGSATDYALTPQDTQTIYNLNPLYTAGYSGQGQTIGIVEDTDSYSTNWQTYRTTFGLAANFPAGSLSTVHPGCSDPGTNADDIEANLDVEVASSVAPSATIELMSCASGTFTFGGQIALQNLINAAGPYPGVVSVSYGECEAVNGQGNNATFYNTYQQAAAQGISVFVSSGDEGPSSCSSDFASRSGAELTYQVASLGITGWGETPYNVSVGGTDFEDTFDAKEVNSAGGQTGTVPVSTYWNSTNTTYYGSAKSYIPEIPWDDSCAGALISFYETGSYTEYGSSGFCNTTTGKSFLTQGAASGGASNCATGAAGTNQSSYLISSPECQGYSKPSWQSGSSLSGGAAVYGQPNDGVRDIPDVSMFASNGLWGHYEVICDSDTANGGASCSGAPSTWTGLGGTSVASPTMAAIQALVNQKTGETWGNPNPIYYQIGQNQYGTAGGTFAGASCNSSGKGGPASSCVFNDVTQGDIDLDCEYNGTSEEAHCYKPSGTYGVDSTDVVTAAAVINGGSGYTSAPTCTIAGPSNNNPYKSPTGTTLFAGGTQASCTAAINAGSATSVWTIVIGTAAAGETITLSNNGGSISNTYALAGTTTTAECTALASSINSGTLATAACSSSTVTATAKTAGYAGNFTVSWGNGFQNGVEYVTITNTTVGQGPGYVSGITITAGGSGYQPETPITLTGGGGSGAVAVANTSPGTASSSYQPSYGAAPGWDMATGLGSPNAYNLVCSSAWGSSCVQSQTITFTTPAPSSAAYGSSFNVAATASSGLTVAFTASGACSVVDNGNGTASYTMTSATGTCSVIANQAGNSSYSAAPTVTETVSATPASQTISFTTPAPSSAAYNSNFTVAATASSGLAVTFTSSGSCSNSGATYTMTSGSGTCSVIANQAGNSSYSAAPTVTETVNATPASQTISFTTNPPASAVFGSSFSVAATATSGLAVSFTSSGSCSNSGATYTMTSGSGTCSVIANQAGNSSYSAAPTVTQTTSATKASSSIAVSSVSPASEDYGSTSSVTITATLSWSGTGAAPTAGDVTISGNGTGTYGATTCGAASGTTLSCSATFTPAGTDLPASYTETASFSGDSNYSASASSQTNNFTISSATTTTTVASTGSPSAYGAAVTFTATIAAENGAVKGRTSRNNKKGVKGEVVGGTVTWSSNTGCATSTVSSGMATCTTTSLPVGGDLVTATYLGDSNHSGSAGSYSQTVSTAATSIAVTSVTPASEDYGSTGGVGITAVLTYSGSGVAPTASNVTIGGSGFSGTFSGTTCGAASGDTLTCSATYSPNGTDAVGGYSFTANFSGDTNYTASSSSGAANFTINAATSSTSVLSSPNPSTYATSVTFTATVTGENGAVKGRTRKAGVKAQAITGTVTWSSNTGCSASTVSGYPGIATCTTSAATHLPVGADTVTAAYSGDGNHSGSTGSVLQNVTGGIATTIDVTSVSPASEDFAANAPTTITAVLAWTGHGTAPTASNVTISGNGNGTYSATTCAARVQETITCTATYTPTNSDVAGTYTETATFTGDINYNGSSSPETNNFTINSASSSTTVTSNQNPSTYMQPVIFTASISGENGFVKGRTKKNGVKAQDITGSVTWSDNTGCGTTAVTSGNPGTATCTTSSLPVGSSDSVVATYSGDSNHAGSSFTYSQTVTAASYTVTWPTPAAITYGTALSSAQLDATSTINGTFAYTPAAGTVLNAGTQTLSVTFTPSDSNYSPTTTTVSLLVNPASTTVTWATPAAITYGTALSGTQLDATASVGGTFVYTPSAGTVLNAGTQTLSVTFTPTSSNYSGSTGSVSLTVNPAATTITWATPAAITYGTALSSTQLDATASVGGTFVYSPAAGTVLNAGTQTLSVTFTPTSGNYAPSTKSVSLTVNPATQKITLTTAAPASAVYNSSFTIAATASSGLAVTYGSSGSCSNSGPTYTMTSGSGSCTVSVSQPGNSNYLAAPTLTETVTATPAAQTVSLTAPSTAAYGSSFTAVATSNAPITATITGNTVCSVSGTTVTMLAASGTCTLTANWGSNADYQSATANAKVTATKATPSVTWPTPAAITYGTALSGTQLDASSTVPGAFKYKPAAGSYLEVGSQTLSVTFTPTTTKDYSSVTTTVPLQVTAAATTTAVTSGDASIKLSKTGSASTTVDFSVSSYKPTGSVTLTAGAASCTGTVASATGKGSCKLTFTSTGTFTVNASYPGDPNHTGSNNSTQSPVTVTVSPN